MKKFSTKDKSVVKLIQSKTGLILNKIPTSFDCVRWKAKSETKEMYLDFYSTGKVVFNFQKKLTPQEKTLLNTSEDFLEPDMKPRLRNYVNLYDDGAIDELVSKVKNHFAN
ncbi:MAG: hypothetical protein ACR2IQ_02035 [Minisyncoccia bacterium]